jgi:hypothetical protein
MLDPYYKIHVGIKRLSKHSSQLLYSQRVAVQKKIERIKYEISSQRSFFTKIKMLELGYNHNKFLIVSFVSQAKTAIYQW